MSLVDNITVTRPKVYKGASYVVYGNLASFPGELESVIHPTTYELAAGLTAICPTTEDGVTIGRTIEVSDGIPIDQKRYALDEGEPETTSMQVGFTSLDTDVETLHILWETPAPVSVAGSVVNQKRLPLNAPETFTERQLYIIQEDFKTGRLRVFAFRKAVPQPDGEINAQSSEASGAPASFRIRPDLAIVDHHGPYGHIFEEEAS